MVVHPHQPWEHGASLALQHHCSRRHRRARGRADRGDLASRDHHRLVLARRRAGPVDDAHAGDRDRRLVDFHERLHRRRERRGDQESAEHPRLVPSSGGTVQSPPHSAALRFHSGAGVSSLSGGSHARARREAGTRHHRHPGPARGAQRGRPARGPGTGGRVPRLRRGSRGARGRAVGRRRDLLLGRRSEGHRRRRAEPRRRGRRRSDGPHPPGAGQAGRGRCRRTRGAGSRARWT